jgi:hypothetical protein
LPHGCAIDSVTVGRNVLDFEVNDVASPKLAVDGEIEHRQVADTAHHL